MPGFLEELPEVRREVAQYYTSVRRWTIAWGRTVEDMKEEGFDRNTIVYGGDRQADSFPFAKSNDYRTASRGADSPLAGRDQAGKRQITHTSSRRSTLPPRCSMPCDCRRFRISTAARFSRR